MFAAFAGAPPPRVATHRGLLAIGFAGLGLAVLFLAAVALGDLRRHTAPFLAIYAASLLLYGVAVLAVLHRPLPARPALPSSAPAPSSSASFSSSPRPPSPTICTATSGTAACRPPATAPTATRPPPPN